MQLWAILVDTWRLLCARRLFWFALVLTALIGIGYASVGFHDKGFFLGSFSFDSPFIKRGTPQAEELYIGLFYQIVKWWTTLFGVILALVSCASIFPEFMASGAIDAMLSKPISRPRLFLFKFLSGLLFAAVQAGLLAVIVFLAIRWRLGFWHEAVFWSVPLVVLLYSYLYAINVLIGVWTRSVLASVLLTLLAWAGVGIIHLIERMTAELSRTSASETISLAAQQKNRIGPPPTNAFVKAHQAAQVVMALLPKTRETTELIRRSAMREGDKAVDREQEIQKMVESRLQVESMFSQGKPRMSDTDALAQAEKDFDSLQTLEKSGLYIVGTSLAFEAAVLALACWLFARRDY